MKRNERKNSINSLMKHTINLFLVHLYFKTIYNYIYISIENTQNIIFDSWIIITLFINHLFIIRKKK